MTQTLRPVDITIYNILFKGFDFVFFIYNAVLSVMWPELTELFAQKKFAYADKIVRKNIIIGVGLVATCTLLVLLIRNPIMLIIAPKMGLTLPISGIILFGLYYIIRVWADTYAVVLQSQNYLRIFWIITPLQAVISASGMYYLSLRLGVNGILIGLIISFLFTAVWILPMVYRQKKHSYEIAY
jgi:O-antigen/teichoic acid export membrane protein